MKAGEMMIRTLGTNTTEVTICVINDAHGVVYDVELWNPRNNYMRERHFFNEAGEHAGSTVIEAREMHGMEDGY